jgi:hypothetical protein
MPSIKDLLTEKEIAHCFGKYDTDLTFYNIEVLSVQNLYKICTLIMPLSFPNGITDGNTIIAAGWNFLTQRAIEKNVTLISL